MAKHEYSCKKCFTTWVIYTPQDQVPVICVNQDCLSEHIKKDFNFLIKKEQEEVLPVGNIVKQFLEENDLILKDLKKEKM